MQEVIKVCHIAHGDLWAGAEVQLATLLEALAKDPTWKLSVILLNEGRLAREIRALGIPVTILCEQRHNAVALLVRMTALLRRLRPHIIHTHKYKDNILAALATLVVRVPVVIRSVHGMTEPLRGAAYVKMAGYESVDHLVTLAKVTKVVAVSANIKDLLEKRYGSGKVVQIHNGINLEKVRPTVEREVLRKALGVHGDEYVVGAVGRLTPVKGHEILFRAACSIMKRDHNIKLLIVGDGPLMPGLKRLAHELGIATDVLLAGHRHDVYDLVSCMDIFVLPSIHEGVPMGLLEAMALGRPVVASRVGGIPEVISHEIHGLLVPAGDSNALAECCRRFLADKELAETCSLAAKHQVEEKFSSQVMGVRVANLYRELYAPHRNRSTRCDDQP